MIETGRIESKLAQVKEKISAAAANAGRDPDNIKLVVVTKGYPTETISKLVALGVEDIGENRVEEAAQKIDALRLKNAVKWHMIGHIQSRKANRVCENFNFVHSIDRSKLARRMDQFLQESGKKIPVLLQVNVSGESTKSGWPAENESDWPGLVGPLEEINSFPTLDVRGLMTMAPYGSSPDLARPFFDRLRRLRDYLAEQIPQVNWVDLSMGMSADYEAGVMEGATILRVGTAILG